MNTEQSSRAVITLVTTAYPILFSWKVHGLDCLFDDGRGLIGFWCLCVLIFEAGRRRLADLAPFPVYCRLRLSAPALATADQWAILAFYIVWQFICSNAKISAGKIGRKYYTRPRARCKVFDESIRLVCIVCSISRTIDLYNGPGSDNTHKCFVLLLLNIFFSTFFIHTSLSWLSLFCWKVLWGICIPQKNIKSIAVLKMAYGDSIQCKLMTKIHSHQSKTETFHCVSHLSQKFQ